MDAYFCDAYADAFARTLRAKSLQPNVKLIPAVAKVELPVSAVFSRVTTRENWRWRRAARDLIEKDNVLSMNKIRELINPFLSKDHKLFEESVIDALMKNYNAPQRLVGTTKTAYRNLRGQNRKNAQTKIREKISSRFKLICQRRNDCIHNCDRPKLALQKISATTCIFAIRDIDLFVRFCDTHLESQFNALLLANGADAVTRNAVGYRPPTLN